MNALLRAAWQQPEVLFKHLCAYGELAGLEAEVLWHAWQRRSLLLLGALGFAFVSLLFAGVGVMACALIHQTLMPWQWLALTGPTALSLLACLTCLWARHRRPMPAAWPALQAQWQLDSQLLRQATTPAP